MDSDKTIIANFDVWQPPVGIPMPEFGIFETYRMYDDPENRNPALTYTQNTEGGFYTHYVDNTNPSCFICPWGPNMIGQRNFDCGNNYGTPTIPLCQVPGNVSEGSVVLRNSGPFHEPGAFACFIVLAIVFHTIRKNS